VDDFHFAAAGTAPEMTDLRATQPGPTLASRVLAKPLTAAERRILALLPTSTHLQIADTLYISRNTMKTHLRSIYQKLGAASRSGLSSGPSTSACSEG
jgi:DNA-binding CsgD family transcriptional regulator